MIKPGAKVGIVTADAKNLTERHLRGGGIDPETVATIGLEDCPLFQEMAYQDRHDIDFERLDAEVRSVTRELLRRDSGVEALLLECSLLPPFAASVQQEFGFPVFDFTTMITMVHSALVRKPFAGYL